MPFMGELTRADVDPDHATGRADFTPIKIVTARPCLLEEATQIGVYGRNRTRLISETIKLRMVAIAFGCPAKHRLREKRLPP